MLAADENPPVRALGADRRVEAAARELRRRAVGEVRAVALARVDDRHAAGAREGEDGLQRLDDLQQHRDVVAQQRAEAAGVEEVALHVDDHERRRGGIHLEGVGGGRDRDRPGRGRRAL